MPEQYVIGLLAAAVASLFSALMYMVKKSDSRFDRQEQRNDDLLAVLFTSLQVGDRSLDMAERTVSGEPSTRSSIEAQIRRRRQRNSPRQSDDLENK